MTITLGGGDERFTYGELAYLDSDHATYPESWQSVTGGTSLLVRTRTEYNSVGVIQFENSYVYMVLVEIVKNETQFVRHGREFIMSDLRGYAIPIVEGNQGNQGAAEGCVTSTSRITSFINPSSRDWFVSSM